MAELLIKAPPELIPVPLRVRALVLTIAKPFRSSTAPLVTETAEDEAPSAERLANLKVPAPMVVPPVKVLVPFKVNAPVPLKLNAIELLNTPAVT